MALNATACGEAMAAAAKTAAAAIVPGTPVTDEQLKAIKVAEVEALFTHLKDNGVITANTFTSPAGPVSGTGKIT